MLSQMFKPSAIRSANVLGQVTKGRAQARYLATVQSNTDRAIPTPQRRSTPISTERATFTIKVRFNAISTLYLVTHRFLEWPYLHRQVVRRQDEHLR